MLFLVGILGVGLGMMGKRYTSVVFVRCALFSKLAAGSGLNRRDYESRERCRCLTGWNQDCRDGVFENRDSFVSYNFF